jgi:hypothetical protein
MADVALESLAPSDPHVEDIMIQSVEKALPLVLFGKALLLLAFAVLVSGATPSLIDAQATARTDQGVPVGDAMTTATDTDGRYISWREHIVVVEAIGGAQIRGGDGLVMADLDLDGHLDIISVHESDTQYDGVADGHVLWRLARTTRISGSS